MNEGTGHANSLELRLLSGLHRGAALELEDDIATLTLGASPQADVLIADPGIAEWHCRLERLEGRWHLHPLDGSVFDASGRALKKRVAIEPGQWLRLHEVWIGLFNTADPWADVVPSAVAGPAAADPATADRRHRLAPAPVLAGVVFGCALLCTGWFVSIAWGRADVESPSTKKAVLAPGAVKADDLITSPAKLAQEFNAALAERELKDRLELQLDADRWDIRGSLDADEQQRLERLLVRFTEAHRPDFPINVTLLGAADLLPFKVVEAVTGKAANVVTDGGERLYVGDTLQGFRLSSVEVGKVVFTGKRRIEVTL